MKLGILTSSLDNLYLFRFLQKHNFSYHIWYDQEGGHRGDKSTEFVVKRVQQGLDQLIEQGITKCILPPSWELVFLQDSAYKKYHNYILPIFSTYVLEEVLPGSRIGKIGLLGDRADLQLQDSVKKLCNSYTPTEVQKAIKNYNDPFVYWSKEVPMWKYFLSSLGRKDWMMHNVVKHDLRYFTDAGVDSLIPLNYGYFAYDVTIAKFFRTKKCRWHRLEKLEAVFTSLVEKEKQSSYSVRISHTGSLHELTASKKWLRMLQKGKECEVVFTK